MLILILLVYFDRSITEAVDFYFVDELFVSNKEVLRVVSSNPIPVVHLPRKPINAGWVRQCRTTTRTGARTFLTPNFLMSLLSVLGRWKGSIFVLRWSL